MKQLFNRLISFFNTIESKIAFYPTLLAFFGFNFAFLMLFLEKKGISRTLIEKIPQLLVEDGDTALTIISACIGGLISMMVFSFSMVMLLLSQASSNFSPRLLPGLISDKVHQIILGIYLATILYSIFILFAIEPSGDKYDLPGIAILLSIIFTIVCICAFIFFIHNISQSIQINNILENIFILAKGRILKLIDAEHDKGELPDFEDTEDWYEYNIKESGYFQNIAMNNLLDHCKENDNRLHILPVKGIFVLNNIPAFKSKNELTDEEADEIRANFNFSRGELIADNYALAFKQITEIIVKAMSPGINDPGTALNAIDYLTELFALRMRKRDETIITKDETPLVKLNTIDLEELLYQVMASIRTYCKQDITVVQKLFLMFEYLKIQPTPHKDYDEIINKEALTLLEDSQRAIVNERDIAHLNKLAEKFKS